MTLRKALSCSFQSAGVKADLDSYRVTFGLKKKIGFFLSLVPLKGLLDGANMFLHVVELFSC